MELIDRAIEKGRTALSEYESKKVLVHYGIPVTEESLVTNPADLFKAVHKIGFPLVMKGCAAEIAHKTEKGLIRLDIRNEDEARTAFEEITSAMDDAQKAVLVQQMVKGQRELVVGLTRDPQFGPCVMFGLGGIFTEILEDTSFRVAPIEKQDALEMMQEIRAFKILEDIRGMEPADKDMLADMLIAVGRIGIENEAVEEIDINPVIIFRGKPVAVDALVVLASDGKQT
jgi:acetyl-CoA synthetase (ADP-forming)